MVSLLSMETLRHWPFIKGINYVIKEKTKPLAWGKKNKNYFANSRNEWKRKFVVCFPTGSMLGLLRHEKYHKNILMLDTSRIIDYSSTWLLANMFLPYCSNKVY